MCKINNFQIFYLFAIEMAVLSVCFAEKGLGPLGVKVATPITVKIRGYRELRGLNIHEINIVDYTRRN